MEHCRISFVKGLRFEPLPMELQGEDGSIVDLSAPLTKELGRGPGIASHDRSVSRRHVRLHFSPVPGSSVVLQVLGPNPICVLHGEYSEIEIVKPGTQTSLELGDKVSLSIQDPVFYTLRRPHHLSPHESTDSGNLREDGEQGDVAADDDEEGIAEAVARWQRRKQERLQAFQSRNSGILPEEGEELALENAQQELDDEQDVAQEDNETEENERATGNEEDRDVAKKFGFIVEGSEFERYGKRGLDTSKWDWRIGRQPGSDDDDEGGGDHRRQQQQQNRTAPGLRTKQKATRRNEDDDDDWRGDNEGEKDLLSARKRPRPQKKDVQTRSQNLASTSHATVDPTKNHRKLVSTSDMENPSTVPVDTKASKRGTTSTSTKKVSKRQPRASESEEEEEDDGGEDLVGFLVDDTEEQEVADEEDESTDEEDEVEDDDEIDEDLPRAHAPGRPVMDEGNGGDDKPLCQYGNKCFRKNKDHLAQFRH